MSEPSVVLVMYLLLFALRLWGLKVRLDLASSRGPEWLFDARIGVDHPRRAGLLRGYRAWLLGPSLVVEALALADVVFWGRMAHVVWLHAPLTLLLGVSRRLVLRSFLLRARDLAAPSPSRPFVLSMKPRRLADYTSRTFEVVNAVLAAGAFAVIARAAWPPFMPPAALMLYVQMGALLRKRSFLTRPVPLPAEQSEDYLRLTEEAFRLAMRNFDWVRAASTFVLVLLAVKVTWWEAWAQRADRIAVGLLAVLVAITVAFLGSHARRGRALLARASRLEVPARPRPLPDPENLHLAGLVYCNADNPAILVDAGPLRSAVNVVNKATYLYAAYWLGLAVLTAWALGLP